jgi:hypothetical protein
MGRVSGQLRTAGEPKAQPELKGWQLPAVHLDGNCFSHEGHGFLPVGASCVPAKAGTEWPYEWDP